MLEAAEGYAVLDREGKRLGLFIELVGGDRIVIRHDGVFVWHRRLLPLTAVADVVPDQRAVVLLLSKGTLADTEAPATPTLEISGTAEEDAPARKAWPERIDRYVGPVEGDADQADVTREGAEQEPSAHSEDMQTVAREEDPPPGTPDRKDHRTDERHLLFISTPAGYSLAGREGPAPHRGDRIELPGQPISFVVVKLGASPLPNDRRSCAYLEPTAEPRQ